MGVAMVDKFSSSRRNFLAKIWKGLGLVVFLQFLAGGVFFLISGRKRETTNEIQLLQAGAIADYPPGSVTLIGKGHLYLTRLDDGGFLAISRKCTHLGCAVPWIEDKKQFECPCHASVFDMTGHIINAPAPRSLDLYPISFDHGEIVINIGKAMKRSNFSADQLAYPPEPS